MIFRCHFNAVQDRGRHVRYPESLGSGVFQVNLGKWAFQKLVPMCTNFCADPWFSR